MDEINYLLVKCPCGHTLETRILGLCSQLGPPTVRCPGCGSEVESGRAEWPDMSRLARVRYFVMSLVYVGIVGFLGGYSYGAARDYWLRRPHATDELPDFTGPVFVTGFLLWGGAVVLLQFYRIFASILRSGRRRSRPIRGFWNLQTSLQLKVLTLLLLIPAFAWLIRRVEDWIR